MQQKKEIINKLRSSNLRPTKQRILIAKKLFDRKKTFHFTAETLNKAVNKKKDTFLWSLLSKWEKLSGEMALVNTSLNKHEESIICNEKEAIDALVNGMIDVLYIDNNRISLKV